MKMLKEKKELRDLSPLFATPRGREEYRDAITAFERAVRADEREKCAKVAEEYDKELILSGRKIPFEFYTKKIAAAIRGRK